MLVRQVEYPFGDFHNPFQWSDAHSKFLSLTQGLMPREQAEEMIRRFTRLDALEDVNLLFPAPIQSFE